jgi:hypothetical protein
MILKKRVKGAKDKCESELKAKEGHFEKYGDSYK